MDVRALIDNRPGRLRRLSALLTLCAATLLMLSASADAKPGYVVATAPQRAAEFQIQGSHGYAIHVKLWNHRNLEVAAYKNPDVVIYLTRRVRARGDGFDATLPGIGRIAVRFQAHGPAEHEPRFFPPCKGGVATKQPGFFIGTIRLRGERGFTVARATRVRGQITSTAKEVCKRSIFGKNLNSNKRTEGGARLYAWSSSPNRAVSFLASRLETSDPSSPAPVFFSGVAREQRGGMAIFREAALSESSSDFAPEGESEFPPSAAVTPTAPFHGSATFQRDPQGGNTWLGNLSVYLPGLGRVGLAGSGFSARFCQGEDCRH